MIEILTLEDLSEIRMPDTQLSRKVAMKPSALLLGILAMACAWSPARGGDVAIISTFLRNKGLGWKSAANVMGGVGPKHVVDFTVGGFTVHDKATGKVLRHLTQLAFWRQVQPVESIVPHQEANDPW